MVVPSKFFLSIRLYLSTGEISADSCLKKLYKAIPKEANSYLIGDVAFDTFHRVEGGRPNNSSYKVYPISPFVIPEEDFEEAACYLDYKELFQRGFLPKEWVKPYREIVEEFRRKF